MLPEVLIGLGIEQFAAMAARALAPKPVEEVSTAHIHVQRVSVREQAGIIVDRLRRHRTTTFRALIADADTTLVIVGRFLALLELYREQMVVFEQLTPLGDLTVRWTGPDEGDVDEVAIDEFDGVTAVVAEERTGDE
jgi:segregation and condensation protein A